ncbi:MAG: DUF4390 domain-containing protein [Gammaproteobacteria bacterium]|nr:DUF4390 domain-containing protein [Gammaproteobacteria bacterium]
MRPYLLNFFVIMAFFLAPVTAIAEGISIDYASGSMKDGFYQIDADINYELSDSVIEALDHGIQLRFDMTVEIKRVRNWRWDQTVATAVLSFTLDYLPLTNNYQVANIITGEKNQFNNLNESLSFLGKINEFPVYDENNLFEDRSYNCFLKSELRIRNLPLPLQPLALISPSWELSSPWYEWSIQ